MPVYEYLCKECGAKFDKLRSMRDADAPIPCTSCQSLETKRQLSTCNCSSEGRSLNGSSGGCGNCSGGSCSSCGKN